MIDVVVDVILPVFAVAALGGWIGRRAGLHVAPLATVTFDLFTPALVFMALRDLDTAGDTAAAVVAVAVGSFVVISVASIGVSKLVNHDLPTLAAAALCASVANVGNMGLPVAALAFGDEGLEIAIIFFVASAVLGFSGGVVLASLASDSVTRALTAPLWVPALWAAILALVFNATGWELPSPVVSSTEILAGAAIPAMLMVLGLQVTTQMAGLRNQRASLQTLVLRLGLGPLVAAGFATLGGLDGVTRNTLIVLGGMPTAVNTTILANRYHARPTWVTQVVVASTLTSVATLTVLLTVLR